MSKIVTQDKLNELVNDKSDNELVTASEAKDLLKITTSKPDNQCVTYGDIKGITDIAVGTTFVNVFGMGMSREAIRDGRIHIYNTTSEKDIELAPAAYPEAAITVPSHGYVVRNIRDLIEIPRSAIVIGKLSDGNIYCQCVDSHSVYGNASWLIVIF